MPVPQIWEEIVEVVLMNECSADRRTFVDLLIPRIMDAVTFVCCTGFGLRADRGEMRVYERHVARAVFHKFLFRWKCSRLLVCTLHVWKV